MKKRHLIYALMLAGALMLPLTSGAATVLSVDFEHTDYTADSAIPTGSALTGGEQWELGWFNTTEPATIPPETGAFTIKSPALGAPAEWGTKCLDWNVTGTGSETADPTLIEIGSMSGGNAELTYQCDVRFPNALPTTTFNTALKTTPDFVYGDSALFELRVQAEGTTRFAYASGGLDLSDPATIAGPVYQWIFTYKDDKVTCRVIQDPYGSPTTILDNTSTPRDPLQGTGNCVGLYFKSRRKTFTHAQVDNILITDAVSSGVDDWMLY